MSATNRGSERKEQDDYQSPVEAIEPLMPYFNFNGKIVLEPAVGTGNIVRVIQEYYPKCKIYATDINENYVKNANENLKIQAAAVDFTEVKSITCQVFNGVIPDIVITNPPYSLAQEFIEQSIRFVNLGGTVIMLLRLNFLGSKKRKNFHNKWPVSKIFVLSKRPSFKEESGTDACEYGWFIWEPSKRIEKNIIVI